MKTIESQPAIASGAGPRARKRSTSAGASPTTVADLGELPLACVGEHLDAISLGRLRCTLKGGLIPPHTVSTVMRDILTACDSLPPPSITAAWETSAWLLHAHMAQKTTTGNDAEDALGCYVQRGAPSQWKYLGLEQDAALAWRIQGYLISEDLDAMRHAEVPLQSLNLSALFCAPFPGFDGVTRGFPIAHLRLSTGVGLCTEMPLESLFENSPRLRCFEMVPKKHSSAWAPYDCNFPLRAFCGELLAALTSPHAPLLATLRLDFSKVIGSVRQCSIEALCAAIAKRPALTEVTIIWPS